jgi:hypothetical protein
MSQIRRVTRLENLARAYLERVQERDSKMLELIRKYAFIRVANLSALILYGEPKMDEPLSLAWKRCLQSPEWALRREKHGGWDEYGRDDCGDPFVDFGAGRIAEYFRKYFLPDLPGSDEIEKFSLIFEKAPPSLLWFTYGDVSARILGIKLPDLSGVNRFVRGKFTLCELPEGPFECHLLPDGVSDQSAVSSRRNRLEDELKHMTPRERKRTIRIYETYK